MHLFHRRAQPRRTVLAVQMQMQLVQQLLRGFLIQRLEQIVKCGVFHRGARVFKILEAGYDDKFGCDAVLTRCGHQFQPGHFRHADVNKHRVRRRGEDLRQPFLRIGGRKGLLKAFFFPVKGPADAHQRPLFVVDYNCAVHCAPPLCSVSLLIISICCFCVKVASSWTGTLYSVRAAALY